MRLVMSLVLVGWLAGVSGAAQVSVSVTPEQEAAAAYLGQQRGLTPEQYVQYVLQRALANLEAQAEEVQAQEAQQALKALPPAQRLKELERLKGRP